MKGCSVPGCRRRHYARGWCNPHYQRWRLHGDPRALRRAAEPQLERELSAVELAWAAGLFDGEGAITFRFSDSRRRQRASDAAAWVLVVRVTMTHEPTVERLRELFGGSLRPLPARQARRPAWYWAAYQPRSEAVLRALLPYLVTKREQALLAVEAMRFRRETPLIPGSRGGHTFPAEAHNRLVEFKAAITALSIKGAVAEPAPLRRVASDKVSR